MSGWIPNPDDKRDTLIRIHELVSRIYYLDFYSGKFGTCLLYTSDAADDSVYV